MQKTSKKNVGVSKSEEEIIKCIKDVAGDAKLLIWKASRSNKKHSSVPYLAEWRIAEQKLEEFIMWTTKGIEERKSFEKRFEK